MKKFVVVSTAALAITALRVAGRRLATHQTLLPSLTGQINTRVIRINQHQSAVRTPPRPEETS